VFLEVVGLARDVGGDFHTVGELHAGDLTDSRVRLARGFRSHFRADAALERRSVEGRAVLKRVEAAGERGHARLRRPRLASLLGQLIDCGHLSRKTRERGIEPLYIKVEENATTCRPRARGKGPPRRR
jgi:hypothetical protein